MLQLVLLLRSGKVVVQETATAAGKSASAAASVGRVAVGLRMVLLVLVLMVVMLLLLRHLLKGWVVERRGAGASSDRSVGTPHVLHQNG